MGNRAVGPTNPEHEPEPEPEVEFEAGEELGRERRVWKSFH